MNKIIYFLALPVLLAGLIPTHKTFAATAGDLVKCPDFNAVYYLSEDGKRHVFPNEKFFYSWYTGFTEVKTISCEDLAQFPLGKRITYRAGIRLLKIPSSPEVFAVEDGGVLREIPSEEIAKKLFGDDWSQRVDDVSEAFWSSFTVGEPLSDDEIPEGTTVTDDDGTLFRIDDDGTAVEIETVLDTDEETILRRNALPLSVIRQKLGLAIELMDIDADASAAILENLLASLRPVHVDQEDEVDFSDVDELSDNIAERKDKALAELQRAEDEIDRAIERLTLKEQEGVDLTASLKLLDDAKALLAQAKTALAADDFRGARRLAQDARHLAMWARGKAVDRIRERHNDDDSDEVENEDDGSNDDSVDDSDSSSDSSGDNSADDSDSDSDSNDDSSEDSDSSSDSNDDSSDDSSDSDDDNSDSDSSGSGN